MGVSLCVFLWLHINDTAEHLRSAFRLTCIDEKLVGDSRMVNIVNSTGKDGSKDLKVRKNSLE